jgi:hypothetical protein
MKLNHTQYLVVNEIGETVVSYDDIGRLTSWLSGKRHGHLKIIVIGTKGRAQVLDIIPDLIEFPKILNRTMTQLTLS